MPSQKSLQPATRWTVGRAAREFRMAVPTLQRRLGDMGQEAGADGCFSSYQLRLAFQGDVTAARLAKSSAETKLIEAKLGVIERTYLKRGALTIALANSYNHMRRIIDRSGIPAEMRETLLIELGASPDALLSSLPNDGGEIVKGRGPKPRRKQHANGTHTGSVI